jgi:hypothetical protein
MEPMRYLAMLIWVLAAVAATEWSTDEVTITMLVILVSGGLMGWLFPRRFLLSGVAIGMVVPAIAIFSQASGWHPGYETSAETARHGAQYAASLLILIVPALIAALCGRWIARRANISKRA